MTATLVADGVLRLTAPNGSVLTGPGTNSYVLVGGESSRDWAIIDPGPAIDSHVQDLLSIVKDRLRWIFVTHTHNDHSPAAAVLAKHTGATCLGAVPPDDGKQDLTFKPDEIIGDGYTHALPAGRLQAIHTPGHVANHLCYLWQPQGMLFTGDHIMQGSTVVIIPPSGDMADYLASLEKLNDYDISQLAPGHGSVMEEPKKVVRKLVKHRMLREQKVLSGLRQFDWVSLQELTPVVYAEVAKKLHVVAQFSLHAHLLKLQQEGRVITKIEQNSQLWHLLTDDEVASNS